MLNLNMLVSIFDNLYDGVLIANTDNIVLYANDSYTRVTGVAKADIINKNLTAVRPDNKLNEVMKTGNPQLGVLRVRDNREWVANVVPIFQSGRLVGGASISNEISDIIKISKELENKQIALERLQKKLDQLKVTKYSFDDIIAVDTKSTAVKKMAMKLASRDIAILILGESGTGKEVYAQAIHNASSRKSSPFVVVNCSTLTPALVDSELFGYADASFTGARKGGKIGIFEAANGGTIFLDEIGDLDINAQAKLLRILQEGVVRPVGSTREREIDVRVISATNKNLANMINDEGFRSDLYYRISQVTINLPPLKERYQDIEPLIKLFLETEGKKNHKDLHLTPQALTLMKSYPWPGNIRELNNVIKTAAVLTEGDTIDIGDFPEKLQRYGLEADYIQINTLKEAVKKAEMEAIKKALIKYGESTENKKLAANALGISIATLYNKLNRLPEPAQHSKAP